MTAAQPYRFFIGSGTTRYPNTPDFEDRKELADEIRRIAELFAELGYQPQSSFEPDLTADQLKVQLRAFFNAETRTNRDQVVFYYTGHGVVHRSGGFLLPFPETTTDLTATAVWASDLAKWLLLDTKVQRLLIILDTCHAGAGGGALARAAIDHLERLGGLTDEPSVAIVTATRPHEQAASGAFSRAFDAAVRHRASGGHEEPFLPLDGVINIVKERTSAWQHARLFLVGDTATEFLPNPRFDQRLRGLDLRSQRDQLQDAARRAELNRHVLPRAQGLDSPGAMWLFTGRDAALQRLGLWLGHPADTVSTVVITGNPGSGKSALLARLHVLADPKLRARVEGISELKDDAMPPVGSIARFIHAHGMTTEQLLAALCEATGVSIAADAADLLAALAVRDRSATIIIDAVDEGARSSQPGMGSLIPLVNEVLAPLIEGAPRSKLRLLIGTRRHLLKKLGGPCEVIDLDDDRYNDPVAVRDYAHRCLTRLIANSPYADQPALAAAAAQSIADAAGTSFLVALITARSLALRGHAASLASPTARAALPRVVADAMRADLDQRLGVDADKARDLLLPLAYGEGAGLPWEDLWPALASALSGRCYTSSDIDWLIETAGFYVIETTDGRRSTYRLHHEALTEHLREHRDSVADQRVIAETLINHASTLPGGRPDWACAHSYTRSHLAAHAAYAGTLDSLVTDPRYLLAAEQSRLLAVLSAVKHRDAVAAADVYRRAALHLRTKPANEHAAYLQLAARCARAVALGDDIAHTYPEQRWSARWASWQLQRPHRILVGHTSGVGAVATTELHGRPVVLTAGNDATVRAWDLATGTLIVDPLIGHAGRVLALTVAALDGRCVVVTGSGDGSVRVWDLATAIPIGQPSTEHRAPVRAITTAELNGRCVVVSGDCYGTVLVWDLATATLIGRPWNGGGLALAAAELDGRPVIVSAGGHAVSLRDLASGAMIWPIEPPHAESPGHTGGVLAVTVARLDGRDVVVSGGADRALRVWDLATGTQTGQPLRAHTGPIRAVTTAELDGQTVIVSGGADRALRVWDLATGTQTGQPLRAHTGPIRAVTTAELDGQTVIVSGGTDRVGRVWDLATSTQLGPPWIGHTDGIRALATAELDDRPVIVTGSNDCTLRAWNLATGTPIGSPWTGHTDAVNAVVVGGPAAQLVGVSGSNDGTTRVWDLASGTPIREFRSRRPSPVRAVALGELNEQPVVVTASDDRSVRVWDLATGAPIGRPLKGHTDKVRAVTVAAMDDQPVVVSGSDDRTVRVWDLRTGAPLGQPFKGHTGWIRVVTVARVDDQPVVVSGSDDRTVRVWDLRTGAPLGQPFKGHTSRVLSVAVTEVDGQLVVVSGGDDRTVHTWNLRTRARVGRPFKGHASSVRAIATAQLAGRAVVVTGGDDKTVRVLKFGTQVMVRDLLTGHSGRVAAVAVAELDGQTHVLSGGEDRTIRSWSVHTGAPAGSPWTGHTGGIRAVAVGESDGQVVVATGGDDRTIRIWRLATGDLVCRPVRGHGGTVRALAVVRLNDRAVLVSGSDDRTVRLWDLATGADIGQPWKAHVGSVRAVVSSELDGQPVVITAGDDGKVRLWNLASRRPIGKPWIGHSGSVRAVTIAELDGQPVVMTGSDDHTVRVWNLRTGYPTGVVRTGHTGGVRAVAAGQLDGRTVVVSGGDDHTVRIHELSLDLLTEPMEIPEQQLGYRWRSPICIDLGATIMAIHLHPAGVVTGTGLGLVALEFLHSAQRPIGGDLT